jgi:inner membrane protein
MVFRAYRSDVESLRAVADVASVQRLAWFNRGFMKAERRDDHLVLSDLRMGAEPDYTFRFAVARRVDGRWQAIRPEQMRWPWESRRRLGELWQRIWERPADEVERARRGELVGPVDPAQAANAADGHTPAASASK